MPNKNERHKNNTKEKDKGYKKIVIFENNKQMECLDVKKNSNF